MPPSNGPRPSPSILALLPTPPHHGSTGIKGLIMSPPEGRLSADAYKFPRFVRWTPGLLLLPFSFCPACFVCIPVRDLTPWVFTFLSCFSYLSLGPPYPSVNLHQSSCPGIAVVSPTYHPTFNIYISISSSWPLDVITTSLPLTP